jgi:lactoylglutathione lyase
MNQRIGLVALVVRDYDEAKAFYTDVLGFQLIEDRDLGAGKRWLVVAPPGAGETRLLLARASTPERTEPYGIVAVFEDLYGNRWDLLELRP